MFIVYVIATRLYFFAISIASLFNSKAKLIVKGQKNWKHNLKKQIQKDAKYIWIHCASLGEFEQGRPLIEKIKSNKLTSEYKIVLSFFSSSGYEVRKDYEYADIICYLPFDTQKNAKQFINIIKPEFAVFVKYEFWHFYLKELKNNDIPAYIISAIFRKQQMFFKPYGKFFLKTLKNFKHLFIQDENSAKLLSSKNINNYKICGDTRIDRVVSIANEEYKNSILEKFSENKFTIVCGSTWAKDEKIISQLIDNTDDTYRFIIAPHEVNERHIQDIEKHISMPTVRYSQIENVQTENIKVVIIDSIGMLSKLYRYGKIAYIGGGFGKGIHNTLEAAVYNIPVIFGPNYLKFKEAIDLVNINVAYSIKSYSELENIVKNRLSNIENLNKIKIEAEKYIKRSVNSTQVIFDTLQELN